MVAVVATRRVRPIASQINVSESHFVASAKMCSKCVGFVTFFLDFLAWLSGREQSFCWSPEMSLWSPAGLRVWYSWDRRRLRRLDMCGEERSRWQGVRGLSCFLVTLAPRRFFSSSFMLG